MELTTQIVEGSKRMEIISLTHQGQELQWQPIERTSIEAGLNVFEQINGYWAYQPVEWQDKVFELYSWIHQILGEGGEIQDITMAVAKPITVLLDLHDLDSIRHWIDFKSNMGTPAGLKTEYQEQDSSRWSREKTYTLEDYRQFVTLSVALRPMLPVWGEFIFLTKKEYKTTWKEYYAYQLVSQARLMESPAMIRLRRYIDSMLPDEEELSSAVLTGISTVDFPEYITAVTVIRRLAIADIRGLPDRPNAISFIFLYLTNRTKSWNNSLMGVVQRKRNPDNFNPDAESKLSQFEEYKVKQQNPAGDIAAIEHELNNAVLVAQIICPDLDLGLLTTSQESIAQYKQSVIHEPQLKIIQYVLKKRISPRAFMQFQRKSVLTAMAITQAILWHKGFYHLAALVSADEQRNVIEYQPGMTRSPLKIPKENLERMDELYPHHRHLSNKNKSQKEKNNAITAIDEVAELFHKHDWILTLPQAWLSQVIHNPHDRKYVVPVDMKIMLSQLVIQIASRTF